MQSLNIPGLSFAVIKNHQIIDSGGLGFSNLELNSPATTKSVYEIGSMTKQFTSMAIMMLAEEGKLTINDKISSYFPGAPPAWNNITIKHLLTHTSGIQNHVAVPGYIGKFTSNLFGQPQASKEQVTKWFFKLPLEFKPGETWAYDNTGYYLLGLIIEKVSKKDYWTFLQERIFTPLGMHATRNTDTKQIVPHRASGYVWNGNSFQNQPVLWSFVGFSAGSLMSTVEDLAKWDAALYSDKLVKQSTLEKMWQATQGNKGELLPYNCGFGWFIDDYQGHRIIQHSGGTPGFSSVIYRFPDDTLTVIILTNHADKMIDQLALDIAGMYQPALIRPSSGKDATATTSRLKTIFSNLLSNKYASADFTPAMNTFLKTSTSRSLWEWYSSFGRLEEFTLTHSELKKDMNVLRYRVMLGNNNYYFTITLTKENKIAQIYFS